MTRVLLGGLVGGIIVFFWGAIAHMALPLGMMGMSSIPDEEPVLAAMKQIREPGLYMFPGFSPSMSAQEREARFAKAKAGPSGILVITPSGAEAMTPRQLLTELASNMLAALVGAFLLSRITGSYPSRVVCTGLMGVFSWLSIVVSYWNWYGFPTAFALGEGITEVVGWLLAGLALAAIVGPPSRKLDAVGTDL